MAILSQKIENSFSDDVSYKLHSKRAKIFKETSHLTTVLHSKTKIITARPAKNLTLSLPFNFISTREVKIRVILATGFSLIS